MTKKPASEAKSFQNSYWQSNPQLLCFRHAAALDLLQKYKVKNFLDIGAGDGFFIEHARGKNIHGKGIELSDEGIKKCAEKNIAIFQQDITDGGFGLDERFDAVTCLDVLEHLLNPGRAMENIGKTDSPYLIVSVPNFNSITARLQMLMGKVPENNSPKKGHCFWFTKKVLRDLLQKHNYDIVEWRCNTLKKPLFIPGLMLRLFPSLFALSFVVISKKNKKILKNT